MAKNIKFAFAPSGVLVYRANGKMYNGRYTLRVGSNGVYTVYGNDGRKIGTVGKGTAKERRVIEEMDRRNRARRIKSHEKKLETWGKADIEKAKKSGALSDWLKAYMTTKDVPRDTWKKYTITYAQQSKMNYAKILSDLVRKGAISEVDANEKWNKMSETSDFSNDVDDDVRSKLWEELRDEYPEVFYKYKE